jgi:hypothetical protein
VKYRVLPRFEADYTQLTAEERRVFKQALATFISAGREHEKKPEGYVWPKSLRVERLQGTPVMAMTWSFSGPDGRATFQLETLEGELWVTSRRVGRHSISSQP